LRILVVDDSPTMRKMIMAALKSLDAEFGEAGNGLEAIECLALHHYDLMTLDINMPDMHGLEVIDFVRQHEAYREIPIVVITTRGDKATRQATAAGEVAAYIQKPFTPGQLLQAVRALLKR